MKLYSKGLDSRRLCKFLFVLAVGGPLKSYGDFCPIDCGVSGSVGDSVLSELPSSRGNRLRVA